MNLGRNMGFGARETNAELEAGQILEDKITGLMVPTKKYFVKLSTRSPKDAVSVSKASKDVVGQMSTSSTIDRLNAKMHCLKVGDGFGVLNLLTKSQRIFSDISMFFQYRLDDCTSSDLCLILRE